jgi:gas vesicle protein
MRDYDFDDEPYVVIERHSGGLGSFIVGLAVGAGVALLFAPRSGAETRRELGRSARRAREAAEELAGDLRESVMDSYEEARQRVEGKIEAARRAVEVKKEQVTRAVEAGREAAHNAREELERRIAETKAAYDAGADVARRGRARSAAPEDEDELSGA